MVFEINKVHLGDCLDIMSHMPDGIFDMILCDLPYEVSKNEWDVIIPFDRLWAQYTRLMKPNGIVILFGQDKFTARYAFKRANASV